MYQFEETDRLWIRKAKKGDAHAFACLYGKIYRDLYRFALGMMKHPQDAEEMCIRDRSVTQDVFSALYIHYDKVDKEKVRAWLIVTAKNQALNYKKKQDRELLLIDDEKHELSLIHI